MQCLRSSGNAPVRRSTSQIPNGQECKGSPCSQDEPPRCRVPLMGVPILHPVHHLAFGQPARASLVGEASRLYVRFSLSATGDGSEFPEAPGVQVERCAGGVSRPVIEWLSHIALLSGATVFG